MTEHANSCLHNITSIRRTREGKTITDFRIISLNQHTNILKFKLQYHRPSPSLCSELANCAMIILNSDTDTDLNLSSFKAEKACII